MKVARNTLKPKGFWSKMGVWSYIAGIVIALLVSIFYEGALPMAAIGILVILGLVVGLINIADSEIVLYLLAAVSFIIAAGALEEIFSRLGPSFAALRTFMEAVIMFTAPGALVVSFKALYQVAKDQ